MRSVTDPNGLTTSYSYDLMDNLVKEVSPLEAETAYTYDKHDIVTGKTDVKGNLTVELLEAEGAEAVCPDLLDRHKRFPFSAR